MGLRPDQIQALLAKPEKRGGKGRGGKTIDTSSRDLQTWFKLAHRLFDKDEPDASLNCDNPNCQDPRGKKRPLVAEVNGLQMCRYCFLEGFGEPNPDQDQLAV